MGIMRGMKKTVGISTGRGRKPKSLLEKAGDAVKDIFTTSSPKKTKSSRSLIAKKGGVARKAKNPVTTAKKKIAGAQSHKKSSVNTGLKKGVHASGKSSGSMTMRSRKGIK